MSIRGSTFEVVVADEERSLQNEDAAMKVRISAATAGELEKVASQVTSVLDEHALTHTLSQRAGTGGKRLIDAGLAIEWTISAATGILTGVIGNAIYARLQSLKKKTDTIQRRETATQLQMTDAETGLRITLTYEKKT